MGRPISLPERRCPIVLDNTTLSRMLGRSVGVTLVLAATTAAAQTGGPKPPEATVTTDAPGIAPKEEDIALPGLDVQGRRQGEYLVPEVTLGGRFPETLIQDIPQSITVVPQELMRQQAAFSLRDALRNVTGISIAAGEGGLQGDNLTLRGFPAKTDLFLDGIRDFGSYTRDVFNLEAVDVLKGPSSVMFGRGSTGGVIDQISKVPMLTPLYNGAATVGTGPFYRGTVDVNQPLGHGIAIRFNAMVEKEDVIGRDEVDVKRYGLAPQVSFGLGTPTTFMGSFFYQHENNTPDDGTPYLFGRPVKVNPDNFYGLANKDFEETDVYIGTLRFEHAFNEDLTLRSIARYAWYGRTSQVVAPRIAGALQPTTPLSTILVNRGRPARDSEESIVTTLTDVAYQFQTWGFKHRLVAGVEYDREVFDITRFTWANVPQAWLTNPNPFQNPMNMRQVNSAPTDTSANAVGVWLIDELALTSWLKFIGGTRWDWFQANQTARNTGITLDSDDKVWSPRTAIVVEPTPNQTYYFSYGTSFNPSAENLTLAANNANIDPEKNQVFELGAKWQLFNNKLAVNTSLFLIEKTDARTNDPDSGIVTLDGKQRSRGYEVNVVGQPLEGWNIWAGMTYLDTRVTESKDVQAGLPIEGKRLPNVPMYSATLWTTYDIPPNLLWDQKFQVGGGFTHAGGRFGNQNNTNFVPSYVRGDLTLAWKPIPKFELRMNALNIGDNRYDESVYTAHTVPAAGRTFLFTGTFTY